jgi:hypothetical protein
MRGRRKTIWGARVAAVAGLGGLLFTVGCGASQTGLAAAAQPANVAQPGTPVVVGCEPNQRTLVRPSVVNGVAVSQVDCVSAPELAASAQPLVAQQPAALPISYRPAASTVAARNADLGDTRIIPASASYPATAARPVPARQVVYDDRPVQREVKPRRSVQKSAIIIGSSAGVGAGVGAAVGGKKGALLGALIGGGGATLWDQVTRRQ